MEQTLVRTGFPRRPIIFITLILVLFLAGCGERAQSPVIVSLTASPDRLFIGESAVVQVEAYDPDGQPLTIAWSTDAGSFTSIEGKQALWTPSVPGRHIVEVVVTNAYGESVTASVTIQVDNHIVLEAGTNLTMELLHDIWGDVVRIGDLVPLRVVEPVHVQRFEVIAEGAFGIGQVVYAQLPTTGMIGHVVVTPTRVQLTDGQIALVNGTNSLANSNGGEAPVAGTILSFSTGEQPKVSSGALVRGTIRADVELEVRGDQIQLRSDAPAPLVVVGACLGIHAVDLSEFVVSVYSDGIRVEGFETGSAVSKSGLQIGDRITGLRVGSETYPITSLADLTRVERLLKPGDEVTVLVRNLLRRADIPVTADICYTLP